MNCVINIESDHWLSFICGMAHCQDKSWRYFREEHTLFSTRHKYHQLLFFKWYSLPPWVQTTNILLLLAKRIIKRITSVLSCWFIISRSIVSTFSKQLPTLFPTRDMGGVSDFVHIMFLKSEKNLCSPIGKCFQDVLLTVMFICLSFKSYR